jgi:protein-S-isoprenylcysteine O-methyltransferase Ste14
MLIFRMFREDFLWLLPALIVAGYQTWVWHNLPQDDPKQTELKGEYSEYDQLSFGSLILIFYAIFWIQLVLPILLITNDYQLLSILRLLGYLMIFGGSLMSLKALKALGRNWSGLDEYQIKKQHQLISSGVFKVVRHPIYSAVIFEVLGFELLANCWLFLPLSIFVFWMLKNHIPKEEKLLKEKFDSQYQNYKSHTKALIPFIY